MCPIGALAIYLYIRIKMSREFGPHTDFTLNQTWFKVKLYTDGTIGKVMTGISPKGYGDAMSVVSKMLGLSSTHTTHLGRVLGPKVLEMMEFDSEEIRTLGNWDPKVQEVTYSTKVPLKALRGMAGYEAGQGMYYNPRSAVPVPAELSKAVFPWVEPCWERLKTYEQERDELKPTATAFLRHMSSLATVLIQDLAAMKLLHPERCENEYRLFKDDPIFNSEAFKVCCCLPCLCLYSSPAILTLPLFLVPTTTGFHRRDEEGVGGGGGE
jgi:Centromere DNA-binding protein complex CBF3 subunit, domain 2